jgi:hypothetical protein
VIKVNALIYDRDDISSEDLEKLHYFIDRYTEGETVMLESGRFLDWINGNTQIMGNTDLYRAIASRPSKSLFKEFDDLTAFMGKHGFSGFPEKVDFSAEIDMSAFEDQLSGIPDESPTSHSSPEENGAEASSNENDVGLSQEVDTPSPDASGSTKPVSKPSGATKPRSKSPDAVKRNSNLSGAAKPSSKSPDAVKPDSKPSDTSKSTSRSPDASKTNSKPSGTSKSTSRSPDASKPDSKSSSAPRPTSGYPDADKPGSKPSDATKSSSNPLNSSNSTRQNYVPHSAHAAKPSSNSADSSSRFSSPSSSGRTAAEATVNDQLKKTGSAEIQKRPVKFDPFLSPAVIIGNGIKKLISAPFKSAAQSYNEERIRRESAQASMLSRGSPELERFGINAKKKIGDLNNEIDSDINSLLGNPGMPNGEKESVKSRIIKNATDLNLIQTQTIDNYLKNDHVGKAVKAGIAAEIKSINKSLQKLENSGDTDPELKRLSEQINQILKGVMDAIAAIFNKKESTQDNTP